MTSSPAAPASAKAKDCTTIFHPRVEAARNAIMATCLCDDEDDVDVARSEYKKLSDAMHVDMQSNDGIAGVTLEDATEFFVMDTRYHLRAFDETEDYDAFRKIMSRGLKTLRISRKRSSVASPNAAAPPPKKAKRAATSTRATPPTPTQGGGANPKPRGRTPSNHTWDYDKGYWVHDETGEIKTPTTKEDRESKKGTFTRPVGKAPHGYDWDSVNGRWVSSEAMASSPPPMPGESTEGAVVAS